MKQKSIDKKKWLEEGFIIQNLKTEYILGQGPFSYEDKAHPCSLYRPDFFFTKKQAWLYPSAICRLDKKQMTQFLIEVENRQEKKTLHLFEKSQKPSFSVYQECFTQVKQAIRQNVFQKAVPVFYETFFKTAPVLDLLQLLFTNTFHLNSGFLYGFWTKNEGFLGFTPEFLFSINGNHFTTMALAGTATEHSSSLFKDDKELKEHEFVLKCLEEKLKPFVRWEEKQKKEMLFPPLKHLRTDLKGQWLSSFNFEKTCQILHPSPAVGGYPQQPAWNWLKNQRSQKKRNYFSAPFAFFENQKSSFCLVALRAIEWNERESRIFSGAGLIKESKLQKEWQELYLKRQQVKSFFT